MPLDRIDFAILDRLVRDSRVSFVRLAKELKVPDTTIHFRIKRMKELGVLRGFTAMVDPSEVRLGDMAVIKLKIETAVFPHLTRDRLDELAREFGEYEEIKFIAISVESAALIAMVASGDRKKTNEIAKHMQKSGGIESVEMIRFSDVPKGFFPLTKIS